MSKRPHNGGYGGRRPFKKHGFQTARGGYAGYAFKAPRRMFVPGKDRTGGYYGRFTNGELKFLDTVVTDTPITAAMVIQNLTVIAEGNGESQRVGRKVTIKSVHIKGVMTLIPATDAANTSDKVFGMLVQDMQTNGAAFTALDLIDTNVIASFRNLANSGRFKVLYKKTYLFNAGGAAPSGAAFVFSSAQRDVNINKKCNIVMEYDNSATTGVITSVRSNNLYWVTQATNGVVNSVLTARIRYSDH